MAERLVFVPFPDSPQLVREFRLELAWSPGFAVSQKKKNVAALHRAASQAGYEPVLEVSTKSDERLGQRLSAFSLKVSAGGHGKIPLECAFQGSKVFERGGPYVDLYSVDARDAKRDERLRSSGRLVGFEFQGYAFPLEPKTVFYDWLYISTLFEHRDWLRQHALKFAAFTDIEFNHQKSINCQARSCALLVSMLKSDVLSEPIVEPKEFVSWLSARKYAPGQAELPVTSPKPGRLF